MNLTVISFLLMVNNESKLLPFGTILDGKYRIDKQVGAGGMGAVFMATHTTIGRRVAIKTLHAEFTSDEEVVARFHREAQLAGSIGHDNICEVTDVGTLADGSPYLVMPLLQGLPLADILEDGKTLTLERVIDIGGQTLSALEAAHNAHIVHRDLKPDNIFITRMGDREDFVKLLDFGISKIMEQDEVTALTMTGTVLGTPFYMSPEQAKGSKKLDHKVDIYAMGVILYEATTGLRPYIGDTYNEIMFKIIAEPFTLPSTINPSISKKVEQVILKAMAKDAIDRFSSAKEMKRELEASASGQSINFDTRLSNAPTIAGSGQYTPAPGITYTPDPMTLNNANAPHPSVVTKANSSKGSKRLKLILGLSVVILILISVVTALLFNDDTNQPNVLKPNIVVPLISPQRSLVPTIPATPEIQPSQPKIQQETSLILEEPTKNKSPSAPKNTEASTKRSTKKKKRKKSNVPVATPPPSTFNKASKKTLEGRFGTTFVGDYED